MDTERLVETFKSLVKIDSETGHERAIADHLKNVFSELGLQVEEDDTQQKTGFGAGNLFITLKGNTDQKPILLSCHMDTVTPGQGIEPIVTDGIIHTDGSTILGADDKAGIAAIIETIQTLQEEQRDHGEIQIVITVGEESSLVGARALDGSKLVDGYGFALDAGNKVGTIVNRAPNNASLNVTIKGVTAHAGVEPEKGVSAINIASRAISNMKLGRIDGETTANIGRIEGGEKTNIVADSCFILAEARSLDEEKMHQQVQHMKEAFLTAAAELGGSADVEVTVNYPSFHVPEESEVIKIAQQSALNIGRTPEVVSNGGGSDANFINSYGVPTVVLAVGYEKIHTVNERIAVTEMEKLTEQVLEIIKLV